MQRRLEEVKAHEEEVRGIVNAHLKREAELKKILEDLFVQHRVSAHLRLTVQLHCSAAVHSYCLQGWKVRKGLPSRKKYSAF